MLWTFINMWSPFSTIQAFWMKFLRGLYLLLNHLDQLCSKVEIMNDRKKLSIANTFILWQRNATQRIQKYGLKKYMSRSISEGHHDMTLSSTSAGILFSTLQCKDILHNLGTIFSFHALIRTFWLRVKIWRFSSENITIQHRDIALPACRYWFWNVGTINEPPFLIHCSAKTDSTATQEHIASQEVKSRWLWHNHRELSPWMTNEWSIHCINRF